jgi:ComF family protein
VLAVNAIGGYENALHRLIVAKFRRSLPSARAAGRLMVDLLPSELLDVDCIVPIPLHWRRYANRGYNQSVEMAKVMSSRLEIPYHSLLIRRRNTKYQYLLSGKERQENVDEVFVLRPMLPDIQPGARILLIDDLCTTGVTLQSAANVLQKLKPSKIIAAVCARALR